MGELLVRDKAPLNLEMPLSGFKDYITSNELFFVRNHFDVPKIDVRAWRLKVDGHVERSLSLSYDGLRKLPTKTVTATLECSGNSRSLLDPQKKGVQWGPGAVGNANWTGVPVAEILKQAGIKPGAVDIVFVGFDRGKGKDGEDLQFLRSVPVAKASEDTLLAYEMNGRPLPVNHGFPARAVVPGWFGVASVKWITRIVVSKTRFLGYFQSIDYSYWDRTNGIAKMQPITLIQVKSIIANPAPGEVLPSGKTVTIQGAAWSGESEVAQVEVSVDGGKQWHPAKLLDQPTKTSWRRWQWDWETPDKPGRVKLLCRAKDAAGNEQPTERDEDRRNYMINHLVPVTVQIR